MINLKRFDRQLSLGILLIIFLSLPLLAGTLLSLMEIVSNQEDLLENHAQKLIHIKSLEVEVANENAIVPVYVLSGQVSLISIFEKSNLEFKNILGKLTRLSQDPREQELLQKVADLQAERVRLGERGLAMKRDGASLADVDSYFSNSTLQKTEQLMVLLAQYSRDTDRAFRKAKLDAHLTSHRIIKGLGLVSVMAILFFCIVGVLLSKVLRQKRLVDEAKDRILQREKQLSTARKETVEVVAHDLRSPLASIIMSTEVALQSDTDPHDAQSALELTLRSAHSMKRLIDDLLDHAKIESGSFSLEKRECELLPLMQELCARFEPLAQRKEIRLVQDFSPIAKRVVLDSSRMEQVISNLLSNALKFTPNHGTITLSTHLRADILKISVADTGRGMTEEQAKHVFERYWQVRENSRNGIGLGLAISQAVVQAHGGQISVRSQSNKGSVFTIEIPVDTVATHQSAQRHIHLPLSSAEL